MIMMVMMMITQLLNSLQYIYYHIKKEIKGSWICIVPHCEKLASEALSHG